MIHITLGEMCCVDPEESRPGSCLDHLTSA